MDYKLSRESMIMNVVFLIITAILATLTFVHSQWIIFGVSVISGILASVSILVRFNKNIKKLIFLFDAVRNDDTMLRFNENVKNKSMKNLHKSMNQMNRMISEIKIKSEHNEKFYKELLKYSATGLMVVDTSGYIVFVNNAALEIMRLEHISHVRLLKQQNQNLYDVLLEIVPGKPLSLKLLNGTSFQLVSVNVVVLRFGDQKYRLYSLYDIKTEMEENQLDTWQKLIRVLTHEIMNSIAPVTSLSNTLGRFFKNKGKAKFAREISDIDIRQTIQGLEVIEERSKGMMHFVNDYRALTKIPQPVFKSVQLDEWMNSLNILLSPRFEQENISFDILYRNTKNEIAGDIKLLNQVMINILNNAVDAVKEKKSKKIIVKVFDNPSGYVILQVIDNGKGILPENLDKIFIPFYTSKKGGSGIGLSLSQQIMRMHKGSIDVQSVLGQQTTVRLEF